MLSAWTGMQDACMANRHNYFEVRKIQKHFGLSVVRSCLWAIETAADDALRFRFVSCSVMRPGINVRRCCWIVYHLALRGIIQRNSGCSFGSHFPILTTVADVGGLESL
jgi:hypothetical protein